MSSPADELLLPAAERVSLALGGGLGAILAVERHRLRSLSSSVLFIRWRTWLITAPIFGAAVMWSRWGTAVFAALLAAQATREYVRMARIQTSTATALIATAVATPLAVAVAPGAWGVAPAVAVLGLSLIPLLRQDVERGARDLAAASFGYLWIGWSAATLVLIRDLAGPGVLLAIGTAVAASDVLAFVAGSVAGRRPLAPRLSPNKTVEGVAGNVVGACLGFALMSIAVPHLPVWVALALPVAIGLACVWGDLLESLVKRTCGVKDAGSWLPGFGGLLDRIDSLLVVLPASAGLLAVAA